MMHGHEKSDSAIVATKPPNKAGRPAAEAVERRAEAKENANRCRTCRTQCRESVSPTPERVRKAEASRQTSEVGAVCRKAARTVLCGLRLVSAWNSVACDGDRGKA
jgi:RNA-directed DNA polymerase